MPEICAQEVEEDWTKIYLPCRNSKSNDPLEPKIYNCEEESMNVQLQLHYRSIYNC